MINVHHCITCNIVLCATLYYVQHCIMCNFSSHATLHHMQHCNFALFATLHNVQHWIMCNIATCYIASHWGRLPLVVVSTVDLSGVPNFGLVFWYLPSVFHLPTFCEVLVDITVKAFLTSNPLAGPWRQIPSLGLDVESPHWRRSQYGHHRWCWIQISSPGVFLKKIIWFMVTPASALSCTTLWKCFLEAISFI